MGKMIDRTGEVQRMNNGMIATIIEYRKYKDIDVQFEDGTIRYNRSYNDFKKGEIGNPNYKHYHNRNTNKLQDSRLGETRMMNNGMMATIIAYRNSLDIDIQFKDGTISYNKTYYKFKKGQIGNTNTNERQASRLGETRKMNNGMIATIIVYRSCKDIDIQFKDGTIVTHKDYYSFKNGLIGNPNHKYYHNANTNEHQASRLGETRMMNNGMMATIIVYQNSLDIDIQFEDGTIHCNKAYRDFKRGEIGNPNYKLMHGVSTNELICSFYFKELGFKKKKNMLELNGKELDLYHSNLNGCKIGIEYDGYKHTKEKDLEKNKLCKQNNIKLYRIRESYLSKLNSTSIDFELSDNNPRSKELEQKLQLLIKKISLDCNISIPLSIDFQRDEQKINKFLKQYHNKYERERLHETRKMNNGMIATIIAYRNSKDIDIQFEDGTIIYNKTYKEFKKCQIGNPNYKIKNGALIPV